MSTQLKTPGVYIEEVSKLPPSVAQVETAIPAFIGYTAKATRKKENDLNLTPTRVTSLLEYEQFFGGANALQLVLQEDITNGSIVQQPTEKFLMYYALQMYFANGGGPCYIVSVNTFIDENDDVNTVIDNELIGGLNTLEREDEPTLLVFPDAISISEEVKFYEVYKQALLQANTLKDRFVIMDTYTGDPSTIAKFRAGVAGDRYGAAYYPHLNTVLSYNYGEDVMIKHIGTLGHDFSDEIDELTELSKEDNDISNATDAQGKEADVQAIIDSINATLNLDTPVPSDLDVSSASQFKKSIKDFLKALGAQKEAVGAYYGITFGVLKLNHPTAYASIQRQIQAMSVVLPPSAAIAGVYARIDSTRGVWKAPANTGLSYVSSLTEKVTHNDQHDLNVDTKAGKSINVIRNFTGKGILVWGARTLDGNSNEWRYVSVRRFFNMVEESVKKAVDQFVFEANDAKTWIKVKTMIENFLNQQWRAGALAGATPKEAYYVSVGLNETMSAQDILEGRMNVEIGMAAVRPAEFIILQFSHKLQES
ncbi:phage tail sheath C-terminal domain-containing protein [Aquimarina sp. 2201CG1-2-11]|uniref:phage tail sheath family protein n=1 Tax=Aquimarina discodermiae TaxID=3231043 RepID=UPI00346221AB